MRGTNALDIVVGSYFDCQSAILERRHDPFAFDPNRPFLAARQCHHFGDDARGRRQDLAVARARQFARLVEQPHVPRIVGGDGVNFPAAPVHMQRHGGETPVLILRHLAVFRANPQRAFGGFKQARNAAAVQVGRVVFVENREADAVEPRQSIVGAHPQIAVARLDHGRDLVLRQPLLHLPGAREIVRRPAGK